MAPLEWRRAAYYRLSPAWRRRARRIAFAPYDAWTLIRGRPSYNGIPLPLRGEVFTGGGDFRHMGLRWLEQLRTLGGLEPGNDVLEIGSGQGRMAIPLTSFLDEGGSYVGMDVVADAVEDCRRRISSRFPAFHFIHLPVMNDLYTEAGAAAEELTFPLDDDSVDFAFATSVFSHMEPAAIANYLGETRRVLRPDGRFVATLFVMDEEARRASEHATFSFPHHEGEAWYMTLRPRSANVAIEADAWRRMVDEAGWEHLDVRPGMWSGRTGPTLDFQDVAILA